MRERLKDLIGKTMCFNRPVLLKNGTQIAIGTRVQVESTWRGRLTVIDPTTRQILARQLPRGALELCE
ncbi:MAG: hypothetical protein AB7O62_00235 [Pirellulales bacterium]